MPEPSELRALAARVEARAKEATPGQWQVQPLTQESYGQPPIAIQTYNPFVEVFRGEAGPADAEHAAASCPVNVLALVAELRRLWAEVDRLTVAAATVGAFKERAADALADAVAAMVTRGVLGSRSLPADALLDYRDQPRTDRSDQLAALSAEVDRLRKAIEPIKVGVASATVDDYVAKCLRAWEETKHG